MSIERQYFQVRLGVKGASSRDCYEKDVIGVDFWPLEDLSSCLGDEAAFDETIREAYSDPELEGYANHAVKQMNQICRQMRIGDFVICPDSRGNYVIGIVQSGYVYCHGHALAHQRKVSWLTSAIDVDSVPEDLHRPLKQPKTIVEIKAELADCFEALIKDHPAIVAKANSEFGVDRDDWEERCIQEHLRRKWESIPFGDGYRIEDDDPDLLGAEIWVSDDGRADIIAASDDEYLVVEIKKGTAGLETLEQIQGYIAAMKESDSLWADTPIKGRILAYDQSSDLRQALADCPDIEFYSYRYRLETTHHKKENT